MKYLNAFIKDLLVIIICVTCFSAFAQNNDYLKRYLHIKEIIINQETLMHQYRKNAKNVIFKWSVNSPSNLSGRYAEIEKRYADMCKRVWKGIGSGALGIHDELKPIAIFNGKDADKLEELLYQNALKNFNMLKSRKGEDSKEYEMIRNSGIPYWSFEGFEGLPSYKIFEEDNSKDIFIQQLREVFRYERLKYLNPLYVVYEEPYVFPPYKTIAVTALLVGQYNNPIIAHFRLNPLSVSKIEINADFNFIKENNDTDRYYYNTFGSQSLLNGLIFLDDHVFMWRLATTKAEGGYPKNKFTFTVSGVLDSQTISDSCVVLFN